MMSRRDGLIPLGDEADDLGNSLLTLIAPSLIMDESLSGILYRLKARSHETPRLPVWRIQRGAFLCVRPHMSFSSLLKLSFVALWLLSLPPAWASQPLVIGDFSLGVDQDGVPVGWELKERSGKADFAVLKDGDVHALCLRSEDASFSFQKPLDIDPREFPVISWKWKVTKLPEGGDFREWRKDDQAAQLFVAFSNANVIVYIWDTTAPQGHMDDAWSPPFISIKAVVVQSGRTETGKWLTETRNAYEDYRELFGKEPPHIAGIRLQINSQHTETSGESFFADVMFKRHRTAEIQAVSYPSGNPQF